MKSRLRLAGLALATLLFTACASTSVQESAVYDFGEIATSPSPKLPVIAVGHVAAPAYLDGTMMVYRLAYANPQQTRTYAHSRWSMPPARLLEQRLKSRIGQAGGIVMSERDAAASVPLLRIDLEEFVHVFDSASHSAARVSLRVSLFRGRTVVAQKTMTRLSPAPSPDAAGGAKAFAAASDAVITDIMQWLSGQPLS